MFNQVWSSRYPRPNKVIFDNGSEFKKNFVPLLKDFSIKPPVTTIKNPQSNAVVEHIHQVIDSMIKIQQLEDQVLDYVDPFGELLASIAWAICSSIIEC
jgi:Integrase core domain.